MHDEEKVECLGCEHLQECGGRWCFDAPSIYEEDDDDPRLLRCPVCGTRSMDPEDGTCYECVVRSYAD